MGNGCVVHAVPRRYLLVAFVFDMHKAVQLFFGGRRNSLVLQAPSTRTRWDAVVVKPVFYGVLADTIDGGNGAGAELLV